MAASVWTGDWDWALPDLDDLLAGDMEPEDRINMLGSAIAIRGWRGEDVGLLLDEVERLAAEITDYQVQSDAFLTRANVGFAVGDLGTTAATYRRGGALSALNAADSYTMAARASLLMSDVASAAADLAAIEATGVRAQVLDARKSSIRAGLAALDGRPDDALALYADAIRGFRDLGVPLDEAFTAIEMATLLDSALPEVRAAADAAREILTRLRAQPFLDRLDTAMASGRVGTSVARD